MRKLFLLLFLSLILISCQKEKNSPAQPELILRYADNQPEYYPTTKAARYFASLVKEKTGGKLVIEVYGDGKLGDEKSTLEQISFGGIDFSRFSLGTLNDDYPELSVLLLPYLYKDSDHMWRVLDGEIGDDFLNIFPPDEVVGLCWFDAGARSFYTTKKVECAEDIKGLKIRVQESELIAEMISLLGAESTKIAYENVYSALKQDIVDGAENNLPSYHSMQHYQVAPYFYMDEHFRIPEVVVMSAEAKDKVEALDPSYMDIIRSCAKEASLYERQQWKLAEQEALENVKKAGCVITVPEEREAETLQALMSPIYAETSDDAQAIIEEIMLLKNQKY